MTPFGIGASGPRRTSPEGIAAIEEREGERLLEYLDKAGKPTIGVGHLLTPPELKTGFLAALPDVDWRKGLTHEQVDELLGHDLASAEGEVNEVVVVALTQGQFDTLVSFAFNIGNGGFATSGVLTCVNESRFEEVPDHLRLWNKSRDPHTHELVVDPILVKRRESECAQWEASA